MCEFSQGKYKQKAFNICIVGMGGEIVIFVYESKEMGENNEITWSYSNKINCGNVISTIQA